MANSIWYRQIVCHVVDYCHEVWREYPYLGLPEDEVIEHNLMHSTMRNPGYTRKAIQELAEVGLRPRPASAYSRAFYH